MFVNHVALVEQKEFTDAIWVYWSQNLEKWDPLNNAVVFDKFNSTWSPIRIGLPSVLRMGKKLAIFYDGLETGKDQLRAEQSSDAYAHMFRDIGMAYLDLPIRVPVEKWLRKYRPSSPAN
jgi:hypothetical protein